MQKSIKRRKEKQRRQSEKVNKAIVQDKPRKKRSMVLLASLFVVLLISFIIYSAFTPGKYDKFAQCLSDKGVMMFGEDWCKYTNAQKNMFGKSFKYINYQVKRDLKIRPTWLINGKTYGGVQSFDMLSELTGCKY
ncbi:hypothetical protein D6777_02225 [Candidatus Woesearchaeota archaeon]|nr:MAG: hypothetical protein D6777_02225 [Candidatus Woesearchaeota archaeon]